MSLLFKAAVAYIILTSEKRKNENTKQIQNNGYKEHLQITLFFFVSLALCIIFNLFDTATEHQHRTKL